MYKPTVVIAVLLMLVVSACRDIRHDLAETRHTVYLGDDSIAVVILESQQEGFTYINLHENETTSIGAAIEHVHRVGGRVIHLEHSGERNVSFHVGDSLYVFDPNRIFTDAGIRLTLDTLSAYSDAAFEEIVSLRDFLLDVYDIDGESPVITVHNNADGGYSILSYVENGIYASDALFVHVSRGKDPDDFFFLTEPEWFPAFRAADFNVVVQDNVHVTDDGSLSVWCGQRDIPYVNVEAQHGHFEIQVRMLDFLERFLTREAEIATPA